MQQAEQQISLVEDQISARNSERRHLQARRDNLRSGASSADREALEAREAELKSLLDQESAEVNDQLPKVAPMLANPGLVAAALQALDERLSAAGGSEQVLVRRIQDSLPTWLREGPPTLHQKTAEMISATLSRRLNELVQVPAATGVFATLDIARALRVRDALMRFSGAEQRRAHAQMLATARRTRHELERVRDTLMQLDVGSQATLEEYRETTHKLAEIDEDIADLNQKLGQQQIRRQESIDIEQRETLRRQKLYNEYMQAEQRYSDAAFVERLALTLNDVREGLRKRMRGQLQHLINEKFKLLVHDYRLIDTIEIDDTYTLKFIDNRGAPVGRSSLSSGVKQLVATAVLWAMKEVPGHEIPVIIDTPLGRIDRENQENMLLSYYPNLAKQVFVLPTNAEIDHRKFNLIRDRVAKQYRIFNETGDRAQIREGSLLS